MNLTIMIYFFLLVSNFQCRAIPVRRQQETHFLEGITAQTAFPVRQKQMSRRLHTPDFRLENSPAVLVSMETRAPVEAFRITPRDAVFYDYYTTLTGVMEKEGPKGGEFEVPDKLKEVYKAKDFSPYGTNNIVTCFITNNDITGGNSGSPVINGNGELIGTAFDGNSEAMSGDIDFEENLQRCINLDARYMLFVVDKIAGAKNLIREMKIVY